MRRAAELAGLLAATALATFAAPPAHGFPQPAWAARVDSAQHYAERRAGLISFALIDEEGRFHGRRADSVVHAASLLKPMLLVAYLRKPSVRDRALTARERSILGPMIRRSDNGAAEAMLELVGGERLYGVATLAHMSHFRYVPWHWGHSETTARDQVRFFYRIRSLLPQPHRAYALSLLARIVPAQRWGFGRLEHPGWRLYFKGGWSEGTGRVDHQVGLLTSGGSHVALAVTTRFNPSHAYGKQTLRALGDRLVRRLPIPLAYPDGTSSTRVSQRSSSAWRSSRARRWAATLSASAQSSASSDSRRAIVCSCSSMRRSSSSSSLGGLFGAGFGTALLRALGGGAGSGSRSCSARACW